MGPLQPYLGILTEVKVCRLVTTALVGNALSLPWAKSTQSAHVAAEEDEGGPLSTATHSFLEQGTPPRAILCLTTF